jgi:CubicO group peptidase (beta-lactamase class C family)
VRTALAFAALLIEFAPLRADEPAAEAADAVVEATRTAFAVPGAAVAIVRGDTVLVLKGYGTRARDARDAVTPDTVFPLASCSKQFTTTLLAMLVDDGALAWDDPVKKHFPEFKLADANATALLTVRDLLCHRTGLSGNDLLWYRAPWTIDHALSKVPLLPLEYPFRSGYRYNSLTFMAAGRIAEKCGKKKWEELLAERVCEPLEFKNVTFTTTAIPKGADRALGHRVNKAGLVERMPTYEMKEPNPAGSVNATARDLANWLTFHACDGVAPSGKRLVSDKPLLETRAPQNLLRMEGATKALFPETVQASHAMGWVVSDYRGLKVCGHGGLIDGFRVQLTVVPDQKLGFAVLTNLHDTRMPMAATNALVDLYCGLKPIDWNAYYKKLEDEATAERKGALAIRDRARDPNAKPSVPLADLAGTYESPIYGTANVTAANGKLRVKWSGFDFTAEPYSGDSFRIADGFFEDELVSFTAKDGKPASVLFSEVAFTRK